MPASLPTTIAEASRQLHNCSSTSQRLTQCYLENIEQREPKLNAFITITDKQALEVAAALDAELQSGKSRGVLHGIPLVIKDNFDTAGIKTTVGSELFFENLPQLDATVVQRLRTAGAVLLGKTNMNEFASGVSGQNRFYGDTHNPGNWNHSPGGSSSGTACAIASGLCLGGVGTDTGGSIRIPASWCGIVGIRPTSALVSLAGVYPRSSSMDVAGPLAASVTDVAILLDAIVGYDPLCPTTINSFPGSYTDDLQKGVKGLHLGVIKNYTFRGIESEVAQAIHRSINTFSYLKAEAIAIHIPWWQNLLESAAFSQIVLYEFNQALGKQYAAARDKSIFSSIIRDHLERGIKISRKTYKQALIQRQLYIGKIKKVFKECDAILTPTTPMVAPLLTANAQVYNQARQFAVPFSFLGVPAISVPCGFDSQGLPIGLQIVGNHFQEALILRIAAAFEATIVDKPNK